jgi:hypothetical protein
MATGTPVLLVPNAWTGGSGRRQCLDRLEPQPQARRAVTDAMPFIVTARKNIILTVNSERNHEHFGT